MFCQDGVDHVWLTLLHRFLQVFDAKNLLKIYSCPLCFVIRAQERPSQLSPALTKNFTLLASDFELLLYCIALSSRRLRFLLSDVHSILLDDDWRFFDEVLLIAMKNWCFRNLSLILYFLYAVCDLLL